jgi:SAM-dependent methyltransferase
MDSLTKDYLISFYDRTLLMHGDRPEALRWSPEGQRARYGLMLDITESLNGKKVLDYGCGKGDFYGFLKDRNINVDYTGTDINPRLIGLARRKYPECAFRVFDIEEEALKEAFDYIFLCGVFNNRVEGVVDTLKNVLSGLFPHCREALALNALSIHTPEKAVELHYACPEELLTFALKNLTPYVALRHDRVPGDFTMFLYREPTRGRKR